eukprot:9491306-Pyramimonas_sp.AAC.1
MGRRRVGERLQLAKPPVPGRHGPSGPTSAMRARRGVYVRIPSRAPRNLGIPQDSLTIPEE